MTGQSVLDDSLEEYANECYTRANALHWALEREDPHATVLLQKQFHGIKFATNGYDYWFLKDENLTIGDFGVAAVLDFFNAKVFGAPFHTLCQTRTLRNRVDGTQTEEIFSFLRTDKTLATEATGIAQGFRRFDPAAVESLVVDVEDTDPIGEREENCCPFCSNQVPYRTHWRVVEEHNDRCRLAREKLLGAPLLILGHEVVIHEDAILLVGDKLTF